MVRMVKLALFICMIDTCRAQLSELGSIGYLNKKYSSPEEGKIYEIFRTTYEDNKDRFIRPMWDEEQKRLFKPKKQEPKFNMSDTANVESTEKYAKMAAKAAYDRGKKLALEDLRKLRAEYAQVSTELQAIQAASAEAESRMATMRSSPSAKIAYLSTTLIQAEEERSMAMQKAANLKSSALKHLISLSQVDQVKLGGEAAVDDMYTNTVTEAKRKYDKDLALPKLVFNVDSTDGLVETLDQLKRDNSQENSADRMARLRSNFGSTVTMELAAQAKRMKDDHHRLQTVEDQEWKKEKDASRQRIKELQERGTQARKSLKSNLEKRENQLRSQLSSVTRLAEGQQQPAAPNLPEATKGMNETQVKNMMEAYKEQVDTITKAYKESLKEQHEHYKADVKQQTMAMDKEFKDFHAEQTTVLQELQETARGLQLQNLNLVKAVKEMTSGIDGAMGPPTVNPKYRGLTVDSLVGKMQEKKASIANDMGIPLASAMA